jgi:hypothetical protein
MPEPEQPPENLVVFHTVMFVILAALLVAAIFVWP